jgi:UDP-N-acetylglucosamine 2-epimerase (non-hydrolysing)
MSGSVVTGQHDEMLKQVLDFFGKIPDHDLEIVQPNQSLYDVTADILKTLADVIVS